MIEIRSMGPGSLGLLDNSYQRQGVSPTRYPLSFCFRYLRLYVHADPRRMEQCGFTVGYSERGCPLNVGVCLELICTVNPEKLVGEAMRMSRGLMPYSLPMLIQSVCTAQTLSYPTELMNHLSAIIQIRILSTALGRASKDRAALKDRALKPRISVLTGADTYADRWVMSRFWLQRGSDAPGLQCQ